MPTNDLKILTTSSKVFEGNRFFTEAPIVSKRKNGLSVNLFLKTLTE